MTKKKFKKVGAAAATLAISAVMFNGIHSGYHYVSHTRPVLQAEAAVRAAQDQQASRQWTANSVSQVSQQINEDLATDDGLYTIRWGDTLWAISQATGVSVSDLAAANGIANPDFIVEGWIIEARPEVIADLLAKGQTFGRTTENIDRSGRNRVMISQPTQQKQTTASTPTSLDVVQLAEKEDANDKIVINVEVEYEEAGSASGEAKENETARPDDEGPSAGQNQSQPGQEDQGLSSNQAQGLADIQQQAGQSEVVQTEVIDVNHRPGTESSTNETLPADQDQSEEVISNESTTTSSSEQALTPPSETETSEEGTADPNQQEPAAPTPTVTKETRQRTERTVIQPGTTYVEDSNLAAGEEQVRQEGKQGSRVTVFEEQYENGVLVQSSPISEEVIPAVDRIVARGTKVESQPAQTVKTVKETIEIAPDVDYVGDPNLAEGQWRIVNPGSKQVIEVTYTETYDGDRLVSREETDRHVINEGLNVVIASWIQEDQAEPPAETPNQSEQPNAQGEGESESLQHVDEPGQSHQPDDSTADQEPTKITKREIKTIRTPTTGEDRRPNAHMNRGQEQVLQEAVDKVEEVTYDVTYENGVEVNRQEVSRQVISPGQKRIVEYGTKETQGVNVPRTIYAVQHGDTLNTIAREFGVSISDITTKTGQRPNASNLKSGQTLVVRNAKAKPYQPTQTDGKFLLYIDVGHGGKDPGGRGNGIIEKHANIVMTNKIVDELNKYDMPNVDIYVNRQTDKHISLPDRSKEANRMNADLFVSVHHNAMGRANAAQGIENFYYEYNTSYPSRYNQQHHNDAQRLVNSAYATHLIHDKLIDATGAVNRGVKTNTFAVLRESKMPAVLLEFGFMDHSGEARKLKNPNYQNKMADAVARGIVEYYGKVYNNGVIPSKKR